MPNIGPMELIVVLVIALLVLGPKKLPEVGRSVGKGIREFKNSISGDDDDELTSAELTAAPEDAHRADVAAISSHSDHQEADNVAVLSASADRS